LTDAENDVAELVLVRAAITAILSGAQDYQIGGQRVTKADLKTLYDREKTLLGRIGSTETYGTRGLASWAGR
jgi:hypothetical protein